jgi:hypothetical protein
MQSLSCIDHLEFRMHAEGPYHAVKSRRRLVVEEGRRNDRMTARSSSGECSCVS